MEIHNKNLLIEPHYLPSVEYFSLIRKYQKLLLNCATPYQRQTYRNRTYILTSQGVQILSIPTKNIDKKGIIDYSYDWQRNHINAIQTAYGKAPFFDYYKDMIFQLIDSDCSSLYDLSKDLILNLNKELSLEIDITSINTPTINSFDLDNFTDKINFKHTYKEREFSRPRPYRQVFGNEFVPNMSIIDLIFCVGPESINYIQ